MKLSMPKGLFQIAAIVFVTAIALYFSQAPSEEEAMENIGIEVGKPRGDRAPYVSIAQPTIEENDIEVPAIQVVVTAQDDPKPQSDPADPDSTNEE